MTEENPQLQPQHTQPRALIPRRLDQQESLNTLNQWKSVFRNYYRRCPYYGIFLMPTTIWDASNNRGFTTDETTGLRRDPETLAADLEGFFRLWGATHPLTTLVIS